MVRGMGLIRGTPLRRPTHRCCFVRGAGRCITGVSRRLKHPLITMVRAFNYRVGTHSSRGLLNVLRGMNCMRNASRRATSFIVCGAYAIHRGTGLHICNHLKRLNTVGGGGPRGVVTLYKYVVRRPRIVRGLGGDCQFISLVFKARGVCGFTRLLASTVRSSEAIVSV